MKFDVLGCVETPKGLIVSLDVNEEGRLYLLERGFNAMLVRVFFHVSLVLLLCLLKCSKKVRRSKS